MIQQGIKYEHAPDIWETIAKNLLISKNNTIENEILKNLVVGIAESGYKDEFFWNEIKDFAVKKAKFFDASNIIDLRNVFVKHFPEEKAFIQFTEQKAISVFYLFGKT
jgi:hypothetical protein